MCQPSWKHIIQKLAKSFTYHKLQMLFSCEGFNCDVLLGNKSGYPSEQRAIYWTATKQHFSSHSTLNTTQVSPDGVSYTKTKQMNSNARALKLYSGHSQTKSQNKAVMLTAIFHCFCQTLQANATKLSEHVICGTSMSPDPQDITISGW